MGLFLNKKKLSSWLLGLIIFFLAICLLDLFSLCFFRNFSSRSDFVLNNPVDKEIWVLKINDAVINAEIAYKSTTQYQGLSNREPLLENEGMLFVFQNDGEKKFVMRNMNFPLDILFVKDGRLVKIYENLPPEGSEPQNIYGSKEADSVLELSGNYCHNHGIEVGDYVEVISQK